MLRAERYQLLINAVNKNGFVTSDDLAEMLGISRSTIQRDLLELDTMHKLVRTRGGAISIKNGTSHEPSLELRKDSQNAEKQRIALAALNYVRENDTILLDSGTTTIRLAELLNSFKWLMAATYDLNIASVLSEIQNVELVVIGGVQRKGFNTLNGYFAEMIIQQMHSDVLFLSADAIDLDHGYMCYNIAEISVKKALMKASREVVALCDHTKFDKIAFINICGLKEVHTIITGKELNSETLSRLREMDIKVILA